MQAELDAFHFAFDKRNFPKAVEEDGQATGAAVVNTYLSFGLICAEELFSGLKIANCKAGCDISELPLKVLVGKHPKLYSAVRINFVLDSIY